VLLYAGRVRIASILQVAALFTFMAITATTGSGIKSEAYQMGFPLVIVIAGELLGVRGASVATAAALFFGALMLGRAPPLPSPSPHIIWIVSAVVVPVVATMQYLSEHTVRRALARARASLAEVQRAEAALRESELRFRTLAEAPFEGIMTTSTASSARPANASFKSLDTTMR